jgi:hypothetical protein
MKSTVIALLFAGCASAPPIAMDPPQECVQACVNLRDLGCPEGIHGNCVSTCERVQTALMADMRPVCLAKARTQDEARACGTVDCLDH